MLSNILHTHFNKQLGSGPSPKLLLFQDSKAQSCLTFAQHFDQKSEMCICIPVTFQHSSLAYCLQRSKIKTVFMKFVA